MESFGDTKVSITILEASSLKRDGKEVNPYVELKYNNKQYRTKTLQSTSAPYWNDTFHIELNEGEDIVILIYDKVILFNDNVLGVVFIPLSSLKSKYSFDRWFDIMPQQPQQQQQQQQQQQSNGRLHLNIKFNDINAIKRFENEISEQWILLDDFKKQQQQQQQQYNPYNQTPVYLFQQQYQPPLPPPTTTATTSPLQFSQYQLPQFQQQQQQQQFYHYPHQLNQMLQKPLSPPVQVQTYSQPHPLFNNNINDNSSSNNIPNFTLSNSNNNSPKLNGNNIYKTSNNNHNNNNILNNIQKQQLNFNFSDSIDIETIELLKSTILEESRILDGSDDRDMLSHCILCHSSCESVDNLFLMDECIHNFCRKCLFTGINAQLKNNINNISSINCIYENCTQKISHEVLKSILGNNEYENYLNKTLETVFQNNPNFIKCPEIKCGFIFERQLNDNSGSANNNNGIISFDGKKLSEEASKHRMENRFRCNKCSTEFCAQCYTVPYHDFYTCEKYKEYLSSRKCRFCSAKISSSPSLSSVNGANVIVSTMEDVCQLEECQQKKAMSCDKIHKDCGHYCIGISGEKECPPCMNEKCFEKNRYHFDDNELCNICWVESINSAPTIHLECQHTFHYACVLRQCKKKTAPRILFNNLDCVICKKQMSHPAIKDEMSSVLALKKQIQIKANERFTFEGLHKSKELEDKKSKWYKNPDAMALDRYVYYQCFKCQQPYFAGAARCDEGIDGYKEEDLLCNSCQGIDKNGECKTHGLDYITWKCKFCCNEASYFCWNKTHFCSACHTKQQGGEYLNKKPVESIPKCPGPDQCPLKISHPHCEEFVLGCSLCKNLKEF